MELPDLKKLKGIIALCRKTGVKTIKIDNIEITLNDDAPVSPKQQAKNDVQGKVDEDTLTPEEVLFWSVGNFDAEKAEQ